MCKLSVNEQKQIEGQINTLLLKDKNSKINNKDYMCHTIVTYYNYIFFYLILKL
jgi:hypothetical protein